MKKALVHKTRKDRPGFPESENKIQNSSFGFAGEATDKFSQSDGASKKIPELLAPAGSPASWAAAIEAGADAVYAGLDRFSARTYADNFTLPELKGLIQESHRQGVRVYLAFNSAIKEDELKDAFRLLMAAGEMGPDGLIIQDPGLMHVARKNLSHIPCHSSTLTAVHSLPGLNALKEMGYARAVLPRELTFREIRALSEYSPIPVEIFVHGALCFSFSGLCLMSSFLGGRSSLRGGCTQPCRRAYQNGGKKRSFFSAPDFTAISWLKALRELPIAAFKIEGRMKGPDYVSRVVAAYRLILDEPGVNNEDSLFKANELLSEAPGRVSGDGFLSLGQKKLSEFKDEATSGLKLGLVSPGSEGLGIVVLEREIRLLDRLRLVSSSGEEGQSFKLRKMFLKGLEVEEAVPGDRVTIELGPGSNNRGFLYKIGSGSEEKAFQNSEAVHNLKIIAKAWNPGPVRNLNSEPKIPKAGGGRKKAALWFWLDNFDSIEAVADLRPDKLIVSLSSVTVREFGRIKKRMRSFPDLIWSLEPLMFHQRQEKIKREAGIVIGYGAQDFMVSNLGHINLLNRMDQNLRLWGDHRLGIFNHLAGQALFGLGLSGVTISPEIDSDSYELLSKSYMDGQILLYLYGYPALFTARLAPPGLKRGVIISPKGEKFKVAEEGEAMIVQSEKAVFMNPYLKSASFGRLAGMIVDLRRDPRIVITAKAVKKAVADGKGALGGMFNFKRGLK